MGAECQALRSRRDLRPLKEPRGPIYLRRVAGGLEIRNGAAVRTVAVDGRAGAGQLVSYSYEQQASRGAPYQRYGLLVTDANSRPLANLDQPLSPMWDEAEIARYADEWGLLFRTAHLRDNSEFRTVYGAVSKVDVTTRGQSAAIYLFALVMVVVVIGGGAAGLVGLSWLATCIGIASRPGVGGALFLGGVALGGVGCLFVMFAVMDAVRTGAASLRAWRSGDGALRPTPRHGGLRLAGEDGELVAHGIDGARLVLPWPAGPGLEGGVTGLRRYRVGTPGGECGLLATDAADRTALVVRCPFSASEVAAFAARYGLTAGSELAVSPGAHELRLAALGPHARLGVEHRAGFFTATVGATLLGALAYLPIVVGAILLLGLVIPAPVMGFLGFLIPILPAPLIGPVTYRSLNRRRGRRQTRNAGTKGP